MLKNDDITDKKPKFIFVSDDPCGKRFFNLMMVLIKNNEANAKQFKNVLESQE